MPYVEIVAMYGGADGHLVRAAADHGAKGIVIQGLGWGNVNLPMFAAIKEEISKGVPVVHAFPPRLRPRGSGKAWETTAYDSTRSMMSDATPQRIATINPTVSKGSQVST